MKPFQSIWSCMEISVRQVRESRQSKEDAPYLFQLLRLGVHDQVDEEPGGVLAQVVLVLGRRHRYES